jgi:hypothetical protein
MAGYGYGYADADADTDADTDMDVGTGDAADMDVQDMEDMDTGADYIDPAQLLALATRAYRVTMRALTKTPHDFDYVQTRAQLEAALQPDRVMLLFKTRDGVVVQQPVDVLATLAGGGRVIRAQDSSFVHDPPYDARDCGGTCGPVPPCYIYFETQLHDRKYIDSRVLRFCVASHEVEMKRRRDAGEETGDGAAHDESEVLTSPHALAVPLDGSVPPVCEKTTRRWLDAMYEIVHAALHNVRRRGRSGRPRRGSGADLCARDKALAEFGICFQQPQPRRQPTADAPSIVDVHLQCFGMAADGDRKPWRISAVVAVQCPG